MFLNSDTIDVLDPIIFCCRGAVLGCRIFSNISEFWSLEATTLSPALGRKGTKQSLVWESLSFSILYVQSPFSSSSQCSQVIDICTNAHQTLW